MNIIKRSLCTILIALGFSSSALYAADNHFVIGIVNFSSCITDSKFGKSEQEQMENIKKQYVSLIEETEKELKDLQTKFDDPVFMEGLSPQAEEDQRLKQKTLNEDLYKYQNQLYQIMQQAQYFFYQKMVGNVSKAAEKIAAEKNLDFVLNGEACFYSKPGMNVTDLVIKEMDKRFDEEAQKNKVSENQEAAKQLADQPVVKAEAKKPEVKNEELSSAPKVEEKKADTAEVKK